MKKFSSMMILMLSLTLITAGCGSSSKTTDNPPVAFTQQGQRPDRGNFQKADLVGEVTEIKGDSFSLKLINQPEPGNFRGQRPQGEPPQGQPQSPPQKQTGDQTQPQPRERTLQYTGETKTVTIPADVPITTMGRGQNGMETNQLKSTDIKIGDVLQIYYSDKEKEVISRISINRFSRNIE